MEKELGEPREITKELLQQLNAETAANGHAKIIEKITDATTLAAGSAKASIAAILSQAANKGLLPRHALHLGDDTMEAIYGQGYNLYNQGKYKDASYIFRLLMLLDYLTPKYMLGLAACLHRLKEYKNAANIYLLCGSLDTTNPLPHYHAADCYVQLGAPLMAIFSLGVAITAAGTQPQYSIIKERAKLMRDALEKQVQEHPESLIGGSKSVEKKQA